MPTLVLSMWCDIFGQEIICYLSCLWETVNSFSDISIDMSIFLHSYEVVFFHYLLRYDVDWKTNILIEFHGGAKIKILDVAAYEERLWG